jgi:serine/threonine protein kinase
LNIQITHSELFHTPPTQLTIIADKLGKLPDSDLDFVTSDKAKRFMKKLPNKSPVHLSLQFPGAPLDALDSMRKMLEIHPQKRISVDKALQHPFFEALHNPADEPVSSRPFDFSFENEKLHRLRLQELIWKEVGHFRPFALPVAPRRSEATGESTSSNELPSSNMH